MSTMPSIPEFANSVMFVGNGRCYHTMDWYRSTKRLTHPRRVLFATDLIDSEGHIKLITAEDDVVNLLNIDSVLLTRQSRLGNLWRNLVKFALLPLQASRVRRLVREHQASICHAHSMYYMFLCSMARVPFIGTPQGSEVLVRPWASRLYRYFAVKALRAAAHVTVDSVAMRDTIQRLCGVRAVIVQNGVDLSALRRYSDTTRSRSTVMSIRNIFPNYRTLEILDARDRSRASSPLIFTYSSWEDGYKADVVRRLRSDDQNLGRVMPKEHLYALLSACRLAISIPTSDSSPRTVYEAIFCGCCVAATPSSWLDALPPCMRSRVVVVDLADPSWFDGALALAVEITAAPYVPSPEALALFDQTESARLIINSFYPARTH